MVKHMFPYAFNGLKQIKSFRKYMQQYHIMTLTPEACFQFTDVYFNVIEAIAEEDTDYLEQIMEKNLYQRFLGGFKNMKNRGYELRTNDLINEKNEFFNNAETNKTFTTVAPLQYYNKEKTLSYFIDARAAFGPSIDRSQNKNSSYLWKMNMFAFREYYLDLQNLSNLYKNKILILNIDYTTKKTLEMVDVKGEVVSKLDTDFMDQPQDPINEGYETHTIRFESYHPDYEWVITDFDDDLNGNPFFPT